MIDFLHIEQRGSNLVAVFHGDGGVFCLNESSLRLRIENVEAGKAHPNRDASVERRALDELLKGKSGI